MTKQHIYSIRITRDMIEYYTSAKKLFDYIEKRFNVVIDKKHHMKELKKYSNSLVHVEGQKYHIARFRPF